MAQAVPLVQEDIEAEYNAGKGPPDLEVITGGKALAEKSEAVKDWTHSKVHEILVLRLEEMFLNTIRHTSDEDLEKYVKDYDEREGFNAMTNRIMDTIHYILRNWKIEHGSIWSIYGGHVRHFANNYFSWYPLSCLLRKEYENLVVTLRFLEALDCCKDKHPILEDSKGMYDKGLLSHSDLWAEAQMIRLGLKEKVGG